jgi:hypothetical protein
MREEPQEVQCQKDFYDKNDKRHTLIFIHGMGQTRSNAAYPTEDKDYRKLWDLLASEWESKNIDKKFHEYFKPLYVNWLYVTDQEENLLHNLAYHQISVSHKYIISSCSYFGLINWLRKKFITYLGDVIAYTDDNDNGIRNVVWNQIKDVCMNGCYSIIAHSLGSVIAYDFVLKTQHHPKFPPFVLNNDYLENIQTIAKNFRGLYTFGSPIGIFFLRRFNLFQPKSNPIKLAIDYPIINSELPWLNFHNPRDPISVPLSGVFASNGQQGPKDIELKFGFPLKAHTGYWGKREMARKIALNLK